MKITRKFFVLPLLAGAAAAAQFSCAVYNEECARFMENPDGAAGYLAGDIWSYAVTVLMASTPFNPDLTLFVLLAVFGFLAVVISQNLPSLFHMPSWLAGWAIGMLTMNLDKTTPLLSLTVQIGVAMLVGVYYIGALIDKIHRIINK